MAYIIMWLICGALAYAISTEGKKGLGTLLGVLLGPLGVLIAAIACRE